MITSFIQYVLMAPSYINVLNVYAVRCLLSVPLVSTYVVSQFANVHDVSWGTKGDNKVQTDLGTVQAAGKNKNEVEVVVPTEQKDINAAYEDALHVLQQKPPKVEQKRDDATKQEDYYRSFRTNVLLVWTLTNGALAAAVTCVVDPCQAVGRWLTGHF
jgi:chitin synthase